MATLGGALQASLQPRLAAVHAGAIRSGARSGAALRVFRSFRQQTVVCRSTDEAAQNVEEVVEPAGPEAPPEAGPSEDTKTGMSAVIAAAKKAIADGSFDAEAFVGEVEALGADLERARSDAELRAQAKDEQVQALKDQFLRLQADFENFRKRQAAEKEQLSEKNTAKVVEEFIPLVDNFELARQQVKCETEGEDKINQAYQGLYRQMVDTFRRLGVDAVPTVGVQFDPAIHDAVMREPRDDVTDGEVVKEFRKGFSIRGRLVRPAMVAVCTNDAMPYVPEDKGTEEKAKEEAKSETKSEAKEEASADSA